MPRPTGYTDTWSASLTGLAPVDSLISGYKWESTKWYSPAAVTSLTYSFIVPGVSVFAPNYSADNEPKAAYALTNTQKLAVMGALDSWAAVANITFQLTGESSTSVGDLRFGGYSLLDNDAAAWAYTPSEKPNGGDVWIGPNTSEAFPDKGTYDFMTFVHEIGHAIGLKHSFAPSANNAITLAPALDDVALTVMSYNNNYSYLPTTPMVLDILAIQSLYGANTQWMTGNNVYSWAPTQSVFETIWDAGGVDTIDASNQLVAVSLNLNEGQYSTIGQAFTDQAGNAFNQGLAIAYGAKIENATGSVFNDTLIGNALDNQLNGMAGADRMEGGAGNDIYIVENVGDVVVETGTSLSEIDMVYSYVDYTLGNNVEILNLVGSANLSGTGNALNNTLSGNDGNNVLDGGLGADFMAGGAGNDTYILDNVGDVVSETSTLASEIDTVRASISYALVANVENLTLTGTANNYAVGNALNNVLIGNDGNNQLVGGAGLDTMIGGKGNDGYGVDQAGELALIQEYANEGNDTIVIEYSATAQTSTVSLNQSNLQNVENLIISGAGAFNLTGNVLNNTLTGNSDANFIDGGWGADTMIGGAGNDTYIVNDIADVVVETGTSLSEIDMVYSYVDYTLGNNVEILALAGAADLKATGNALNNTLYGNDGNNVLDGGLGADFMTGGAGNDTYILDNVGDVVSETSTLASEIDTVRASISYALVANVENLTLTGTANNYAVGNALNNVLIGNDGNNQLVGGAGLDTMIGGKGNDGYGIDQAGELALIQEYANEGNDTIVIEYSATAQTSTVSLDQSNLQNVENLIISGAGAFNLTGNALNNTLTGNSGNNVLDGGLGADFMAGGAGNDTYILDNVGDVVSETSTLASEIDTVRASISYALVANVENLTLTGTANNYAVGNALNNVLIGNDGNNQLVGGAGLDTMIGGKGNDGYGVDQAGELALIQEYANEGNDTIVIEYSATAQTSTVSLNQSNLQNVENLIISGAGAFNLTGNVLNNTLTGNSDANFIDGGWGADTMIGGAGNDTYIVNDIADVVVETGTSLSEIDMVYSYVDYTLGNNVEILALAGAADLKATGNALNNTLYGNDGNNVLDGGLGADFMTGGAGNDTYILDNVGDVVSETSTLASEIDTVRASISYALVANVENLTLTGTANNYAVGNALNNVLIGNDGNNQLVGGAGLDTMIGGKGNDGYGVDQAGELALIQEYANEGNDTIVIEYSATAQTSTVSLNQSNLQNVENLIISGAGAFNLTGNVLNNTLTGNSDANFIDGGWGADTMIGGAGNDTYIVNDIADVVVETGTSVSEIDMVYSYVDYTLGNNVEILALAGAADLKATGNALNNTLYGNDGNNVLDGGAGKDTLIGGNGADTFVFRAVNDMGVGASRDVITDFSSLQGDKIDLTKFDANLLQGGMDGFTFIGANDFTGAGQLRFVDHVLSGNVSGNAGADFEIQLVGVNSFSANDLVA
ncbi:M10 family metallopeptidase C-terminal domain-containing protein [Pseudomonas sp. CP4]|uniref:M10 family metallopeptidase C-terminal domain-containing protein n=1 Tax=Pseudomonas sp. CP4 TaxID=3388844 RepID=UPI0039F086A8